MYIECGVYTEYIRVLFQDHILSAPGWLQPFVLVLEVTFKSTFGFQPYLTDSHHVYPHCIAPRS